MIIEPGGIRTEWADIAADKLRQTSGHGAYGPQAEAVAEAMAASRRRQSPPQLIADTIAGAVTAARPKTRYAVGFAARPTIFLRRLLSDRAYDGLMRRATGISKVV